MPTYNVQEQDAESLREILREYRRLTKSLELAILAIEEDNVTSLQVRNSTWLDKGLTGTRKWIEAVREAHYEWRVARGSFQQSSKRAKKG